MIVASNTSPLINLAAVSHLNLLQELYGTIYIPQAVYDEIVIDGVGQAGANEVDQADWIKIEPVINQPMVSSLQTDLDVGEAEAIVLAVELNADLLLLDERKGRLVAHRLGLNYIGLLGLLIRAKQEQLISDVKPTMDRLRQNVGFWVSDELYDYILQTTEETK